MNFFIHIGTHKTGSTSLQHFFLQNRLNLIKQGFLYPEIGIKNAGHHKIAWVARNGNESNRLKNIIARIKIQAERADCENVILSSEEFEFVHHLEPLKAALAGHHCKIIVFIRRQDTLLESEYNQHVKMPSIKYADSIFKFHFDHDFSQRFNYKHLCDIWSQTFGQENIHPISFDHCSKQPQGIFKAIFKLINMTLGDGFDFRQNHQYNTSLPNKATIYLARLNKLPLIAPQHHEAIRLLNELFPKKFDRPLLSLNDRKTIWKRYRSTNDSLERILNTQYFDEPSETEHHGEPIDFYNEFDASIYASLLFRLSMPKEN
jgi:hypothetical protein